MVERRREILIEIQPSKDRHSSLDVLYLVPDLLLADSGMGRHARIVCEALSQSGISVRALSLLDPSDSSARGPGVTQHGYGGNRWQFASAVFRSLLQRPRLVLVQHASFSSLGWMAARLAGAHFVVFAHGIEVWEQLPLTRRFALRRAGRIICVSKHTAERAMVANQLDPRRVRILPNCLDPAMSAGDGARPKGDAFSLLTVGRMSQEEGYKGHDMVLRALPTLRLEFPTVRYDIVGSGDRRPALEQLARELGVGEYVYFHGLVPETVLLDMYRRASVFVMPSRGEGFGLAFIEAMAFGTPVIAARSGASVEIVRDGETGLLVDPDTPLAIESALRILLSDEEYRNRLGQAAQQDAQSRFGFPGYRERLLALLEYIGIRSAEGAGLRNPS